MVTRAKALLGEKSDNWFTTGRQDVLADDANRYVFEQLVEVCPEWFAAEPTSITWPVNTENVDVSGASYLNAEPYRIRLIRDTPASGAVSPSNPARTWESCSFKKLTDIQSAPFRGKFYYCLQGVRLYVAPIPTETLYLKVHWIAQLAALASSSTEVLAGAAEPYGDCVAYRLAFLANASQGGSNQLVTAMWAEAENRIRTAAHSRTNDGPKRLSYRGRPGV